MDLWISRKFGLGTNKERSIRAQSFLQKWPFCSLFLRNEQNGKEIVPDYSWMTSIISIKKNSKIPFSKISYQSASNFFANEFVYP